MGRLSTAVKTLDSAIEEVVSATLGKNDEEMLRTVKALKSPIQVVISNRPLEDEKAEKLFGISMLDIANSKLQRAKDVAKTAYSISKQCAICTTVVSQRGEEEELLTLHDNFDQDVSTWDSRTRLPCHACKDCFGNFMNFKSSLGRPMLRCPGMNCRCFLDKKRVEAAMPDAFAKFKDAMMRYSLKRVENYRTCPNADCSAGSVLDSCCKSDKVTCASCNWSFCPKCNDVPHEGMTCEELQRKRHEERWGNAKDFMANETKQCPHCLTWIEKNGGCNHMTCHHCRGEFCWLCFGDWREHYDCNQKKAVVRRPFGELFPDWTEKPKKTLKPRFSPGKYVEFKAEGCDHTNVIARVSEVAIDGIHVTYVVEPVDGSEILRIEESLLRGYNKSISSVDLEKSEEMEAETYASFLSGFDQHVKFVEDVQSQHASTLTTEISPYESFLSGFESDDESEDEEPRFKGKLTRHSAYILKQSQDSSSSLKKQIQARAIRELERESEICDGDDEEESSAECPNHLWESDYEPFEEEESSACVPSGFWGWEWEGEEDSEIIAPVAFLAALYDSECESDSLANDDVEEEESHEPEFYGLFAADSDSGTNSEDDIDDKKFDYGFSSDDEEESS